MGTYKKLEVGTRRYVGREVEASLTNIRFYGIQNQEPKHGIKTSNTRERSGIYATSNGQQACQNKLAKPKSGSK